MLHIDYTVGPFLHFPKYKLILNFVPHMESTYGKLESEMVQAKSRCRGAELRLGGTGPNEESHPLLLRVSLLVKNLLPRIP